MTGGMDALARPAQHAETLRSCIDLRNPRRTGSGQATSFEGLLILYCLSRILSRRELLPVGGGTPLPHLIAWVEAPSRNATILRHKPMKTLENRVQQTSHLQPGEVVGEGGRASTPIDVGGPLNGEPAVAELLGQAPFSLRNTHPP